MPQDEPEYSTHRRQLESILADIPRLQQLADAIREAFEGRIVMREVGHVQFGDMTAEELADAFFRYPILVKATAASVNVAQRAIRRDLGMQLDTYASSYTREQALILATYLKPLLPHELAVSALLELDRFFWVDKELRAMKGRWEQRCTQAVNALATVKFKKRRFSCDDETFEIDAATPTRGPIAVGIDVKRIESPRDIHKRADEVLNKARKFKRTYPDSQFFALVYYPFPTQQANVQSRLASPHVDGVFFAGETASSIEHSAALMLGKANMLPGGADEVDSPTE